MSKTLVFKVQEGPGCGFKLSQLVELAKTRYDLREGTENSTELSIVFSSYCRAHDSLFYKVRVAASISIAICDPEIGNICPLKSFEFDRPIRGSDWSLAAETIVRDLQVSGNSDRILRIGDVALADPRPL
jgi:hypothetical protein